MVSELFWLKGSPDRKGAMKRAGQEPSRSLKGRSRPEPRSPGAASPIIISGVTHFEWLLLRS